LLILQLFALRRVSTPTQISQKKIISKLIPSRRTGQKPFRRSTG